MNDNSKQDSFASALINDRHVKTSKEFHFIHLEEKRKVRDRVAVRVLVTREKNSLLFMRRHFSLSHYKHGEKGVADVTHTFPLNLVKILLPTVFFHHVLQTFLRICQF